MENSLIEQKVKKKKRNKKNNKLPVVLTKHDHALLNRFCKVNNISKSSALRKIVHKFLQENVDCDSSQQPQNQLDLFDPVQMDIFDVIRKQ